MSTNATMTQNGADTATEELTRGGPFYRPNVDIYEQADELTVLADMPVRKTIRSTFTSTTAR